MKIATLLYSFIFLCAGFCCEPEDDNNYEYYNFEVADLISIENESPSFEVGDTLWVKTSVPLIIQNSSGSDVNISQLVGGTSLAYVQFSVFQQSNFDNPLPIRLSEDEIVVRTGQAQIYNEYFNATAELNGESFESYFGIKLKNSGSFFISSDIYNNGMPTIFLDTRNGNSVNIATSIVRANAQNRYNFTVE